MTWSNTELANTYNTVYTITQSLFFYFKEKGLEN
jgi:hypothetical protein